MDHSLSARGLSTQERILVEQRVTNEAPSIVVAYLLWFFLGWLAAHRFYLRRPGTAILQILLNLVLVGLIWWVIDAFLIPGLIRRDQEALRERLSRAAVPG